MRTSQELRREILEYYSRSNGHIDMPLDLFQSEDQPRVIELVNELRRDRWLSGPPSSQPGDIPRQHMITGKGRSELMKHLEEQRADTALN
jgi:hypothetical protein